MTVLFPRYYRLLRRDGPNWLSYGTLLTSNKRVGVGDLDEYGLTVEQLISELFRVRVGAEGFYIANLRAKKYYYCGLTMEDVKSKFLELGIGRRDPLDNV